MIIDQTITPILEAMSKLPPVVSIVTVVSVSLVALGIVVVNAVVNSLNEKAKAQRVHEAEQRRDEAPEKSKFAWDLARITLESYFDRNLRQVSSIYWLSVFVMLLGVVIIFGGIGMAAQAHDTGWTAFITAASGVITEVIGATFLILYRSTMDQAGVYIRTLERINSVGMAMQVLDTMPAGEEIDSGKNKTKAELVMVLITQSYELTKPRSVPAARKPHAGKGKALSVVKEDKAS
jgi:uncharacterized membrane protein YeiB